MFWLPRTINHVETLSVSVKAEIGRRVADEVYKTLRTGKYLEDAYIFELANEIAKKHAKFEFVANEDSNTYSIKIKEIK